MTMKPRNLIVRFFGILVLFCTLLPIVGCSNDPFGTMMPQSVTIRQISPSSPNISNASVKFADVENQVFTLEAEATLKDSSKSKDVAWVVPEKGITLHDNSNGAITFTITDVGTYTFIATARYNGKNTGVSSSITVNVLGALTSLGVRKEGTTAITDSITISTTDTKETILIPVYTPEDTTQKDVSWEFSSNDSFSVVEVSNYKIESDPSDPDFGKTIANVAKVKALSAGTGTIKLVSDKNPQIYKDINIIVRANATEQETPASSLSFTESNVSIPIGSAYSKKLTVNVIDGYQHDITTGTVRFESSDPEIVEISNSVARQCTIVGKKAGSSMITATFVTEDGTELKADVRVSTTGAVEKISTGSNFYSFIVGTTTTEDDIKITYAPLDTTQKGFSVFVEDSSVAKSLSSNTEDAVILQMLKAGETEVTVSSIYDDTISTTFTVEAVNEITDSNRIKSLSLDKSSLVIEAPYGSKTEQLNATTIVYVDDSRENTKVGDYETYGLRWESSAPGIVSVTDNMDGTATITPVAPGEARITATSIVAGEALRYQAFCDVTVTGDIESFIPDSNSIQVMTGASAQLTLTPYPSNAILSLPADDSTTAGTGAVSFFMDDNTTASASATMSTYTNKLIFTIKGQQPGTTNLHVLVDGEEIIQIPVSVTVKNDKYLSKLLFDTSSSILSQDADSVTHTLSAFDQNGEELDVAEANISYEIIENGKTSTDLSSSRHVDIWTDENGTFIISPLEAGVTTLRATAIGNTSGVSAAIRIEVGGSVVHEDLQDIRLNPERLQIKEGYSDNISISFIPYSYGEDHDLSIDWDIIDDEDGRNISITRKSDESITVRGDKAGMDVVSGIHSESRMSPSFTVEVVGRDEDAYKVVLDKNYLSFDRNQKEPPSVNATVYKNGKVDDSLVVDWRFAAESNRFITKNDNGNTTYVSMSEFEDETGSTYLIAELMVEGEAVASASCFVEVVDSTAAVELRAITTEYESLIMNMGTPINFKYETVPYSMKDETDFVITYSRNGIVTASQNKENGIITVIPLNPGNVTLTISNTEDTVSTSMQIAVEEDLEAPRITNMSFSDSVLVLPMDGDGEYLTLSATDQNGRDMRISSDDVTYVVIEKGEVKNSLNDATYVSVAETQNGIFIAPEESGVAVVRAVLNEDEGVYAECRVEVGGAAVVEGLTALIPSSNYVQLQKNGYADIEINFIPSTFDETMIDWEVKPEGAASSTRYDFREGGTSKIRIYGENAGKDTYIATAVADEDVFTQFTVEVVDDAEDAYRIELDKTYISYDLAAKANPVVTATVYKNNTVDRSVEVEWETDDVADMISCDVDGNEAVIILNDDAVVGTGRLTAKLKDDANITASCFIEVVDSSDYTSLRSLTFENSSVTMKTGSEYSMGYSILPESQMNDVRLSFNYSTNGVVEAVQDKDQIVFTSNDEEGLVVVTVTATNSKDGSSVSERISVRVSDTPAISISEIAGLSFDRSALVLDMDGNGEYLTVSGVDQNGRSISVRGKIDYKVIETGMEKPIDGVDLKTVRIDSLTDGLYIEPNEAGIVIIRAYVLDNDEIYAECRVEVGGAAIIEGLTKLIPSSNHLQVQKGGYADASIYFIPSNYADRDLDWTVTPIGTSKASHYDVRNGRSENIRIYGDEYGSDTYTATYRADDGTEISTQFTVEVVDDAYSIALDKTYISYDLASKADPVITATIYKNGHIDSTAKVEWESSDTSKLVSYHPNGNRATVILRDDAVTGSGTITAKIAGMNQISASCHIEVVDSSNMTALRAISFGYPSIVLTEGETFKVPYSVIPESMLSNTDLTFSYSRNGVVSATQDKDNHEVEVTAINAGSATITVTAANSKDGSTVTGSLRVQVNTPEEAKDIANLRFNRSTLVLPMDGDGEYLTVSATDQFGDEISSRGRIEYEIIENGISKALTGDVSYVKGIETSDGLYIEPANPGISIIRAYVDGNDEIYAECRVEIGGAAVIEGLTKLIPSSNYMQIQKGGSDTALINFIPSTFEDKRVDWEVIPQDAASVTRYDYVSGKTDEIRIHGLDYGIDTYKATSAAENSISTEFKVEVVDDAYSLRLDRTYISYDLAAKANPVITATVYRNGVEDSSAEVEWESAEIDDLVSYSADGNKATVVLKDDAATGTGTITAKLKSNPNITASCFIEVVDSTNMTKLRNLSVDNPTVTIYAGDIYRTGYSILPETQIDNIELSFRYGTSDIVTAEQDADRHEIILTGLEPGNSSITLTALNKIDQTTATTTMNVRVLEPVGEPRFIELDTTYLELSQEDMDITSYVNAKIMDDSGNQVTGTDTRLTWTVEEGSERIIRWNAEGSTFEVSPLSAGEVEVTCSFPGLNPQILTITVGTADAVYGKDAAMLLPSTDKVVMKPGSEMDLWVSFAPNGNTKDSNIKWQSDNDDVTVVSSSKNPAVATVSISPDASDSEEAMITVTADDSLSTTISVVVKSDTTDTVTAVMLDPQVVILDLASKDLTRFTARLYEDGEETDPNNRIDIDISGIEDYVTIQNTNMSGVLDIIKKAEGSGVITFSSVDDPEMTVRAYVDVVDSTTLPKTLHNVVLSSSARTMLIGETFDLEATVVPQSITNATYTFESGNGNVAEVVHDSTSNKAEIIGKGVGTTDIIVTAEHGDITKSASMKITVPADAPKLSHISLSQDSITLDQMRAEEWTEVTATVMTTKGSTSFDVDWIVPDSAGTLFEYDVIGNTIAFKPLSAGNAIVEARYNDLTARLNVSVGEEKSIYGEIIALEPSINGQVELLRNGVFQIWVTPVGGSIMPEIEWTAEGSVTVEQNPYNLNYATVTAKDTDGTGKVTASIEGKELEAVFNFNVSEFGTGEVSAVTITPSKLVIDLDSKALPEFTATSYVDGVAEDNYSFSWKVDDNSELLRRFASIRSTGAQNATGILSIDSSNADVTTGYVRTYADVAPEAYSRAVVEVVKSSEIQLGLQDILVSVPDTLTMTEGQVTEVRFTAVPSSLTSGTDFTMQSEDPSKVRVYENQLIAVAQTADPVTITVRGENGIAEKMKTIEVSVVKTPAAASYIRIDSNNQSNGIIEIANGGNATATATLYDTEDMPVSDAGLKWTVEDASVARISTSDNGHTVRIDALDADSFTKFTVSSGDIEVEGTIIIGNPGDGLFALIANPSAITLSVNEKVPFTITPVPTSMADEVQYSYQAENNSFAMKTENDTDYIVGQSEGEGEFKIIGSDGISNVETSIDVKVSGVLTPARIQIDRSSVTLSNSVPEVEVNAKILSRDGKVFDGDVSWLIDDENVATVMADGTDPNKAVVTAVGAGQTMLKASYEGLMASIPVTFSYVDSVAKVPTGIHALSSQIILDNPATEAQMGDDALVTTADVEVGFTPSTLDDKYKTVKWSLSGTSIEIDEAHMNASPDLYDYKPGDKTTVNGKLSVKAVKEGTTTVRATSMVDPSKWAEISVIVLPEGVRVEGGIPTLDLDKTRLVLEADGIDSSEVTATLKDADGAEMLDGYADIEWTLNPEGIVTMSDLDTKSKTFTSKDGVAGRTYLKVSYPVELTGDGADTMDALSVDRSIAIETIVEADVGKLLSDVLLDRSEFVMIAGDTEQLFATLNPNVIDATLTWISNNDNVVSVEDKGLTTAVVTAENSGTATVTVTAKQTVNDETITVSDSVKITVLNGIPASTKYESLEVDNSTLALTKGGSAGYLTYTLTNGDGTVNVDDQITKIEVYGLNGRHIATYETDDFVSADGSEINSVSNEYFELETVGNKPRTFTIYPLKSGTLSIQTWVLDDPSAPNAEALGGVGCTTLLTISGDVKSAGIATNYIHMAVGDTEEVEINFNPSSAILSSSPDAYEWSVVKTSGEQDFIRIEDTTVSSALIRAMDLGEGVLKYKYEENGVSYTAQVEILVEDRASLSGGVKKISFPESYDVIEYPYPSSQHYEATVSFFDGSSTNEDIVYYFVKYDDQKHEWVLADESEYASIARIEYHGETGFELIPVGPGTVYIQAACMPNGATRVYDANIQIDVRGAISALTPSHSKLVLYTGGSTELTVTPDDTNAPGASYVWRVKDEKHFDKDTGALSDVSSAYASALEDFIIMDTTDASSVVVGARDLITDDTDPTFNENLFNSYPRRVTIEVTTPQYPDVSAEIVVDVLPLAVQNYYPKTLEIEVPTTSIDVPDSGSFTQDDRINVTATVTDRDGAELEATVDWYFYPIGNNGDSSSWTTLRDDAGTDLYKKISWIDPDNHLANDYVDAYLNEETNELSFIPRQSGQFRLKAIARENPYLQKSQNIYVSGEVEGIYVTQNENQVNHVDIIKDGSVVLNVGFNPSNALAGDPIWILRSQRYSDETDKHTVDLSRNKYFSFTQTGRSISIRGLEVTDGVSGIDSDDLVLYCEYYDDAEVRQRLKNAISGTDENGNSADGKLTLDEYEDITNNATKKIWEVNLNVLPKDRTIITFSISDLPESIDPSDVKSAIPFTVTATASGAEPDTTFSNWDWLDVEIVGADSGLVYATTRMITVEDPAGSGQKKKVADWDSDQLQFPIADNGLISHNGSRYSFVLNPNGIPEEPVYFTVDLIEEYKDGFITDDEKIFDKDTLSFSEARRLCYIGGKVTSITAGTTTYNLNNNVQSSEGSNVDMILGASAVLTIEYNPTQTHQKGVIWYAPDNTGYTEFQAMSGGNQCSVFGRTATITSSGVGAIRLRAVSIYDPWFEEQAALYLANNPDSTVKTIEQWRTRYFNMTNNEHVSETQSGGWFRYPREEELTPGLYYDYQITVQSLADEVKFTSISQAKNGKVDPDTGKAEVAPGYYTLSDTEKYPKVDSLNEIFCYDSTGTAGAIDSDNDGLVDYNNGVAAYLVQATLSPDYGYDLTFQIEDGLEVGYLDDYEIDKGSNQFRFVPNGARITKDGDIYINYGDVKISATIPDLNISKSFILHYQPSNIKLVKYIGEEADGSVPSWWDRRLMVVNGEAVLGDPETDDQASGYWDISYDKNNRPVVDHLQCLVLYPGEEFELSAIKQVNGEPQYVANGVNLNSDDPNDDGSNDLKYAISYTVSAAQDQKPLEGYIDFIYETQNDTDEHIRYINNSTSNMTPVKMEDGRFLDSDGQSDWIRTAKSVIKVPENAKQGAVYLSFSIAPVKEGEFDPTDPTGSGEDYIDQTQRVNNGLWVFISEPVDQLTALTISNQYQQENPYATPLSIKVEYPISVSQLRPPVIDGKEYPSHWFMGADGYVLEGSESKGTYSGVAFLSFDSDDVNENIIIPGAMKSDYSGKAATKLSSITYNTSENALLITADNLPEPEDISPVTFRGEPAFEYMELFGEFGLTKFPGVTSINIVEDGTSNSVISKYLSGPTGSDIKYPDLPGAVNLEYYRHSGMGAIGQRISAITPPPEIKELRLSDNQLNCTFIFDDNAKKNLEVLDISENRFPALTIEGLEALKYLNLSGKPGEGNTSVFPSKNRRFLNVLDCKNLRVVNLDDTAFQDVVIEFHEAESPDMFYDPAYLGILSAKMSGVEDTPSTSLETLAISGSLAIVDLRGANKLTSFIHSPSVHELSLDNLNNTDQYAYEDGKGHEDTTWIQQLILGYPADQLDFSGSVHGYDRNKVLANEDGEYDENLMLAAWQGAIRNYKYPDNTTTRENLFNTAIKITEEDKSKSLYDEDYYKTVVNEDPPRESKAPLNNLQLVKIGMLFDKDDNGGIDISKDTTNFDLQFVSKFCDEVYFSLSGISVPYVSYDVSYNNMYGIREMEIKEIGDLREDIALSAGTVDAYDARLKKARVSFINSTGLGTVKVGRLHGELNLESGQVRNVEVNYKDPSKFNATGSLNLDRTWIEDTADIKGSMIDLSINDTTGIKEFRIEKGDGKPFHYLENFSADGSYLEKLYISDSANLKTLSVSDLPEGHGLKSNYTADGKAGGSYAFVIEEVRSLESIDLSDAGLYGKNWMIGTMDYRSTAPAIKINGLALNTDGEYFKSMTLNPTRYENVEFHSPYYYTSHDSDGSPHTSYSVPVKKTITVNNENKKIDWMSWIRQGNLKSLILDGNQIGYRWETGYGSLNWGELYDSGIITDFPRFFLDGYTPNQKYRDLQAKANSGNLNTTERLTWNAIQNNIEDYIKVSGIDIELYYNNDHRYISGSPYPGYFDTVSNYEVSEAVYNSICDENWREYTPSSSYWGDDDDSNNDEDGHENDQYSLRLGMLPVNDGIDIYLAAFKKYKAGGALAEESEGYLDIRSVDGGYKVSGDHIIYMKINGKAETKIAKLNVNDGKIGNQQILNSEGKVVKDPSGLMLNFKHHDQNTKFYGHDSVAIIFPFGCSYDV